MSSDRLVYLISNDFRMEQLFSKRDGYKVCKNFLELMTSKEGGIIVFPGGYDINPEFYGEERLPKTIISKHSDERDKRYWDAVKDRDEITKVGICRGAQFLNVMNGGALFQDVDNHTEDHHMVDLFITKSDVHVTSTHHQMMIPNEDNGVVLGITKRASTYYSHKQREKPEFDTEVVFYPETKSLCFQPHPEYSGANECRLYFFDLIDALEI